MIDDKEIEQAVRNLYYKGETRDDGESQWSFLVRFAKELTVELDKISVQEDREKEEWLDEYESAQAVFNEAAISVEEWRGRLVKASVRLHEAETKGYDNGWLRE